MKSWPGEEGEGGPPILHIKTPYRLDKLRSALAEVQLKKHEHLRLFVVQKSHEILRKLWLMVQKKMT